MAAREAAEMSFSVSDVRERMREKKKGALRTAKLNASLASKIKTKIMNNSSFMKMSLMQNNKALALALNEQKANARRLTQEKTILLKEVEQCNFHIAELRHKLSVLSNIWKKMETLMAAVKIDELCECHTNPPFMSSGQKSSVTEDSWADDIADSQLLRVTQIPMRVPISKLQDAGQQAGSSTAVQTSSAELQRPASNEPLKIVPVASKDTLPPQHKKSQFHREENGEKATEAMATEEAFHDSCISGDVLRTTEQNPNNLPALAWESHHLSYEADEMANHFFGRLSQGHVTQRRKRSTLFARSTPSSALDVFPHVNSTPAAQGSAAQDNSSSKNNTQQQLRYPSPLSSPAPTAVTSNRNSAGKETFCDQPQTKETRCDVETDPSYSQVLEFAPAKVKIKGNCKTEEKKTVKQARTGKNKSPATRIIWQRDHSSEQCLPNIVIIPETKTEETPKRRQTNRKNTVRNGNCDQRNEDNAFGPSIDVQGVANESTKDLPGNLKHCRETYIVRPLDLAGSLGCCQTEFEGDENVPPMSVPGNKASRIPRAAKSNKNQTGGLQEEGQDEVDSNLDALKKIASCKPKPQRKRSNSQPPDTDSLARKSDGAKVLIGSSTEFASKQTVLMGRFSCITNLLSEPHALLEKQLPEISLADSLTDLSQSLESSHVSSSAVLPLSSRLTVSKSLSTEGNRMPAKSPVGLKNSLIFKEKTAEETPGERNQVQSSSWSSPSQEPGIRPFRDLKNARVLSPSGLEETSGCSSRRKRKPTCYKEPSINRKLRQGDPFTDTEFLYSPLCKRKKKPVKAKGMTKREENKECLPEGCLSAKFLTTDRIQD